VEHCGWKIEITLVPVVIADFFVAYLGGIYPH
jgi:hypothetical protein